MPFGIQRPFYILYAKRETQSAPQDMPERRKCSHRTYIGESGGGKLKNVNPQGDAVTEDQHF